jgi:hypothetical protein
MQDSCKWAVKVCSKNRFNDKLAASRRDLICTPACRFFQEHNKSILPDSAVEFLTKPNPIISSIYKIKEEVKPVVETPHRGRPFKK